MRRLLAILAAVFLFMGSNLPALKYRALDSSGVPMSGAKLYFYTHGTTTPKATYSDEALSSANANPVVADAHGWFGEIYMNDNDPYKVVLKSAAGVTVWTLDNIKPNQLSTDSFQARLLQIASSPLDYGAVGDGVADDSTEVQAAITGATGVVDLLGKTYRCDSFLVLKSGLTIRNGTLDFSNSADSIYLVATGTEGSNNLLTGNVSAGATTIPVTSVAGLAIGDVLWLTSTAAYGAAVGTDGELVRIAGIAALNVSTAAPLNGSYTVATSASVKEITTKYDIIIDDVTVRANKAATGTGILFAVQYVDRLTIRNSVFTGIKAAGVQVTKSTLIHVDGTKFELGSASAIGVNLLDGSLGVTITGGSSFTALDKCVALGLDGAGHKGVTRDVNIASSTFESCATAAIHAGILSQHLSMSGDIIRVTNPADGANLTSIDDVRIVGTTFVGGDYGIDDTTVTNLLMASNYFTGQTTGSVKGAAGAVLTIAGSSGNQIGVQATGFGTGAGVAGAGGATSGAGITATGGAPNGYGVTATADGAGRGVHGTGGDSSGVGVYGTGGAPNGHGVYGVGDGVGEGALGVGGDSSGTGVYGTGGNPDGHGGEFLGSGTGYGIIADGEDGYGAWISADATAPIRAALKLSGQNAAPSSPENGAIYYNNVTNHFYGYNGAWVQLDN